MLKRIILFVVIGLSLTAGSASTASALESFATYPALPSGYSSIKVFDRQGRFAGRILSEKRYWTPH